MSMLHIEVSEIIDASPERIYKILADYHQGHQAILPQRYFTSMTVQEGGNGAGTIVEVAMNVMGARRHLHLHVSEREPGRVLVETDLDSGIVTTFTIKPLANDQKSHVTIQTDTKLSPGLRGFIEKLLNPPITRQIYREELALLSDYAITT